MYIHAYIHISTYIYHTYIHIPVYSISWIARFCLLSVHDTGCRSVSVKLLILPRQKCELLRAVFAAYIYVYIYISDKDMHVYI